MPPPRSALRAAAALTSAGGSRSLLLDERAQRLAREALLVCVCAARPPVREAFPGLVSAAPPGRGRPY